MAEGVAGVLEAMKAWKAQVGLAILSLGVGWFARPGLDFVAFRFTGDWRAKAALKDCGGALPYAVLDVVAEEGVPLAQFLALWKTESDGNAVAISAQGAVGGGQIMPAVAARYGYTAEDMKIPELNAAVTCKHLKAMRAKFGKCPNPEIEAVCAYNVGDAAWRLVLAGKQPMAKETERQRRVYWFHRLRYDRWLEKGVTAEGE